MNREEIKGEVGAEVIPSCGCVFCDLCLEPERLGDELVHFTEDPDRPLVICTKGKK